ncbi:hypothetical protein FBU31_002506, partial [Coemansia sp. 'formosensis']
MSNCTADEQRHTEQRAMEHELEWLLAERIPKVVSQAQNILLGISLCLKPTGGKDSQIHLHDAKTGEDAGE